MRAWRALFAFAVLRLGLAPDAVWALSLAEWAALIEALAPFTGAMSVYDLKALIQQYPDKNHD